MPSPAPVLPSTPACLGTSASTPALVAHRLAGLLDEVDNHAAFWVIDSPSKGSKKVPSGRPPWGRQKPAQLSSSQAEPPAATPAPALPPHKRSTALSPPQTRPPSRASVAVQKRPDTSLHVVCAEKLPASQASALNKWQSVGAEPRSSGGSTTEPTVSKSVSIASINRHVQANTEAAGSLMASAQPCTTNSLRPSTSGARPVSNESILPPSASTLSAMIQCKRNVLNRPPSGPHVGWDGLRESAMLVGGRGAARAERIGLPGGASPPRRRAAVDVLGTADELDSPPNARNAEAWLNRMLGNGLDTVLPPSEEAALLRRMGTDRDIIEEMEEIDMGLHLDDADTSNASTSRARCAATQGLSRRFHAAPQREKMRRQLRDAANGLQNAGLDRIALASFGIRTNAQVSQLYNLIFVYSFGVRDALDRLLHHTTPEARGELTLRVWRTLVGLVESLMRADLGSEIAGAIASLERALAAAEASSAQSAVTEAEARHAFERRLDAELMSREAMTNELERKAAHMHETEARLLQAQAEVAALRAELDKFSATGLRQEKVPLSGVDAASMHAVATQEKQGDASIAVDQAMLHSQLKAAAQEAAAEREQRLHLQARLLALETEHAQTVLQLEETRRILHDAFGDMGR